MSIMIAVRKDLVEQIELLEWRKIPEGKEGEIAQAYTRMMVCNIVMDESITHIGRSHVIMNVHLHHKTANHYFGKDKLDWHFKNIAAHIKDHNVTVLMGDFSTALPLVVPTLRTLGVEIDLGAWFPWRALVGTAMHDSCALFLSQHAKRIHGARDAWTPRRLRPRRDFTQTKPTVAGAPEDGFDLRP